MFSRGISTSIAPNPTSKVEGQDLFDQRFSEETVSQLQSIAPIQMGTCPGLRCADLIALDPRFKLPG